MKGTIAFYIGSLSKGGAERVIVNLAEYFYALGYTVYVVTKASEGEEYSLSKGIPRILADITKEEETKSRLRNLINRVKKLRGIFKEIAPDIIVSFIRKNNIMALASTRGLNIPVIVSVRSAPSRELKGVRLVSFLLFGFAKGIVLQTNEAKSYFPARLKRKAIILPNSINEDFFRQIMDKRKAWEEEKKGDKQIVCVGRIDGNKNQSMLIKTFISIIKKDEEKKFDSWYLHLYGDGSDREKLEAYVKDEKLSERIIFHGITSDIPEALCQGDIFVLPSKMEGMPNALIEAMAAGLACISTDCPSGGPRDLIESGKNGILIGVDDCDALKSALMKLMGDFKLRAFLGENAKSIADRLAPDKVNYSWKNYIEGFINAKR